MDPNTPRRLRNTARGLRDDDGLSRADAIDYLIGFYGVSEADAGAAVDDVNAAHPVDPLAEPSTRRQHVDMALSLAHGMRRVDLVRRGDMELCALIDALKGEDREIMALVDRAIRAVHGSTADMVTREEGMRSVCERLEGQDGA